MHACMQCTCNTAPPPINVTQVLAVPFPASLSCASLHSSQTVNVPRGYHAGRHRLLSGPRCARCGAISTFETSRHRWFGCGGSNFEFECQWIDQEYIPRQQREVYGSLLYNLHHISIWEAQWSLFLFLQLGTRIMSPIRSLYWTLT